MFCRKKKESTRGKDTKKLNVTFELSRNVIELF